MEGLSKSQKNMVAVLLAGTFLAVLNQTLLTPALPTIMRDLSVDATTVQWLTSGYSLVEAVIIPLAAYLMGRFSTRKLFNGGLTLFACGSVVAAIAPNFVVLLVGRLMQACCTGILLPMASSLILLAFPKERRGAAMGIVGLVVGFAPAVGPVVSGLLIDGIGWRALFWVVAVLAAIIVACGVAKLENYEGFPRGTFDAASVVLACLGMVSLLYGLSISTSVANLALPVVLILIGAVLLAFFARRQLRSDSPMLNLRILREKNYRTAVSVVAIIQCGFLGMQVILPLYIQGVLGYSATMSGLALLPGALCGAFASMAAGKLFDRVGIRKVAITGGLVTLVGSVCIVVFGMDTPFWFIWVAYLILSVGLQFVMTPINTWGVNSLDNSVVQHAQSLSNTMNQVAGSLGTVLLVALSAAGSAMAPAGASPVQVAFDGYHLAFCGSAVLFLLFFVIVLLFARDNALPVRKASERTWSLQDAVITDVYSVPVGATALDAAKCLVDHRTSGVPVVDGEGSVAGFVTDGDITRALSAGSTDKTGMYYLYTVVSKGDLFDESVRTLSETPVMDIATRQVVSIDADGGIENACRVLSATRIKKAPVMRDGRLVGVLSRSDLIRYLLKSRTLEPEAGR
ncbi:MAG: MDR family MFS transporter [Coriobacteriales bacterium]|jgi:DHA2 family multidrug resistance protein-like MFS transporter